MATDKGRLRVERETVAVLRVRTAIVTGEAQGLVVRTTGGTTKPMTLPPPDAAPPPSRGPCGSPGGCGAP